MTAPDPTETNYLPLFEDNPMPMWVVDCETCQFLAVNRATVEHYGYSREEFLAMTYLDIRPTGELERIHEYLRMREDFHGRFVHRKKTGELITVEVTAHQTRFRGRPARAVLANDITERTRAEEALRASEERLRLITETIQEIFWMIDPSYTRYLYLSPAFEQIFQRPRAVVLDNPRAILDCVNPEDRVRVRQGHDALAQGTPYEHEFRILRPDGTVRWIRGRGFPVRNAAGAVQAYVGVAQDITDRKALEAQVQRLDRTESVGRLASGIAHDMNNILAPVIMGTALLRTELPRPDRERLLDSIDSSAHRGAALVRQLLIFGRGIEGERRVTDPRAIVNEIAGICTQTFPRNIAIVTSSADGLRPVLADATQLQQVVLNLAVNARDAMPNGGRLEIALTSAEIDETYAAAHKDAKPGPYTIIRVADTGTGMAPAIAEHIFEPFFTTKPQGKGTGLGLPTVLGIIKSHGGFIRVRTALGEGTTFEVYLPASNRSLGPEPAPPARHAPLAGNRELVLVVDDEEAVRGVLRETLIKYNYRVVSAEDGVEATAAFAANPGISLVITDLDMPLMDGINLARVLRRMNPEVRIVVSTGLGRRSEAARRSADFDTLRVSHLLMKPYTAEQLLRVVHAALHDAAPTGQAASC